MDRRPLEDEVGDILAKAQKGCGWTDADVARQSGVAVEEYRRLRQGGGDAQLLSAVAEALGLSARALVVLAEGSWYPEVPTVEGLRPVVMPFRDWTVNAYIVRAPASREAIVCDAGTSAAPLLAVVKEEGLTPVALLITHTHRDHVGGLGELRDAFPEMVLYAPEKEPLANAETVRAGDRFDLVGLTLEALLVSGHSPGQTAYAVEGLARPVVIVGDALFAGSVGGAGEKLAEQLERNRTELLGRPHETVLCPGHGPLTTVGQERQYNAFLAGQ